MRINDFHHTDKPPCPSVFPSGYNNTNTIDIQSCREGLQGTIPSSHLFYPKTLKTLKYSTIEQKSTIKYSMNE
jgi:hypothetical protein